MPGRAREQALESAEAAGAAPEGVAAAEPAIVLDLGTPWPQPILDAWCRAAGPSLLRDRTLPPDEPTGGGPAAKKILAVLSGSERAALQPPVAPAVAAAAALVAPADQKSPLGAPTEPSATPAGGAPAPSPASGAGAAPAAEAAPVLESTREAHAEAIAARIALAAAEADGRALLAQKGAVLIDSAAVADLTGRADAAAVRLQGESSRAIAKGELETLQAMTASRAALSRDLLAFKDTLDQLRGLETAPALGPGALDPEIRLREQQRAASKPVAEQATKKDEFAEYRTGRSAVSKSVIAVVLSLVFAGTLYRAVTFFGSAQVTSETEAAAVGALRIAIVEKQATVTVSSPFNKERVGPILEALRRHELTKGVLVSTDGVALGIIDVPSGRYIPLVPPAR